ncbi:MAG: hypothetical protein K5877_06560 [Lachnospiraceae bacterium]|nr:hypothetical protein [Lachnospiraceae bacterium]
MSKNSPLYPFNDWYDINQYFTVGRGILHGKVPYVDLVDQKGPYLYLLGSVAYLFSHTTFLGWFILEVINLFVFSLFTDKTIRIYYPDLRYSYFFVPVLCTVISSCEGFQHGGSAEEFSLGILSFALYSILKTLHDKRSMDPKIIFINGILAGVVFWTKFTMTGLFIVFAVFMFIYSDKKIRSVLLFLAGVLVSTIPLVLYFGINGAIVDWLNVYFYENIFGYGKVQQRTLLEIFLSVFKCLKEFLFIKGNIALTGVFLFSAIWVLLPGKISRMLVRERLCIILMVMTSSMGVYAGGFEYGYYGMVLCAYLVIGILPFTAVLKIIIEKLGLLFNKKEKMTGIMTVAMGITVNAAVLFAGISISDNVYLLGTDPSQMPQFIFADIIRQAPEDSRVVLNYGFLDEGVYTLLDQVPQMKYFASLNGKYEETLEIQAGYIYEGIPDYVLTFYPVAADEETMKNVPVLQDGYHLVAYKVHYIEGNYSTFGLWEKN